MDITTVTLSYGPNDRSSGFAARPTPATAPLPAVIVLQEIFGVDGHIRDVTRRYTEAGYFAFVPDLYSVGGKRPPHLTEARIEAVKQFMDRVPPGEARDPDKRLAHLAKLPEREAKEVGESLQGLFGGSTARCSASTVRWMDRSREACPTLPRA